MYNERLWAMEPNPMNSHWWIIRNQKRFYWVEQFIIPVSGLLAGNFRGSYDLLPKKQQILVNKLNDILDEVH